MSNERRAKWLKRLMALGISYDDAEDLLQNALLEAFEYLHRLHPEATPETIQSLMTDALIGRILKCRVADFFRDRKKELQLLQEYIADCQLRLPDEDEWWTFQAACEVLEHLPECWQEVVQRRMEGYSWEEIAAWTGKPTGTLAPGLERAVNKACEDLGYLRKKKLILIDPGSGSFKWRVARRPPVAPRRSVQGRCRVSPSPAWSAR